MVKWRYILIHWPNVYITIHIWTQKTVIYSFNYQFWKNNWIGAQQNGSKYEDMVFIDWYTFWNSAQLHVFFRLNLPLNKFRRQCYKFRRQCYKFRRQCYDGVAKRIQELEPGQCNHILKATRWMRQQAACCKAPCWCDVDITGRHQTYKVFGSKRRYIPSNQGEYRPTGRQWQNRCSNHVPFQIDDKGRRPG